MRLKASHTGITFLLLFICGIMFSKIIGYWATEGSKTPVRYTKGQFTGEYNPADIRGSYSLGDIEKAFEIPAETLAKAFGFSNTDNPEFIQVKTFENLFVNIDGKEIDTDSIRYFVSLYKGFPYTPEDNTALPKQAVSILKAEGSMSKEQLTQAESSAVFLKPVSNSNIAISEEHGESEIMIIKGKTTFGEIYNWGVSKKELEEILGIPVGADDEKVRDFCISIGIEFSTVKIPVQEMLDKL